MKPWHYCANLLPNQIVPEFKAASDSKLTLIQPSKDRIGLLDGTSEESVIGSIVSHMKVLLYPVKGPGMIKTPDSWGVLYTSLINFLPSFS